MEEVVKSYKGFRKSITNNGRTTEETYTGYKEQCEQFISTYRIGQFSPDYGTLSNISLSQEDGPYWTVALEWSVEKNENGEDQGTGNSYGPTSSSLTVRMLSLPLEKSAKYRTNWNYILVGYNTKVIPDWWYTTKSLTIPEGFENKYKWIKENSELLTLDPPVTKENIENENLITSKWKIVKDKTKPGVESYDYPIYELTESSKHSSKTSAGWAVAKKAGKIESPSNGDFRYCR